MRGHEQRSPYPVPNHILPISPTEVDLLAASQVDHCLRNSVRFASPTGRLTPQLAEDPYLLTSSSKVSLHNVKLIVHKFKF
jgi:hypothetical protein